MQNILIAIINFLYTLLNTIIPTINFDSSVLGEILDSFSVVFDFIAQVNFLIPIPDILLIIGIDIVIHLGFFVVFCYNWVVRRIFDVIP